MATTKRKTTVYIDDDVLRPKFRTTPEQVERYVEVFRRSAVMVPDASQPWPALSSARDGGKLGDQRRR